MLYNDRLKSYERYGDIKSEKCLWEPNCIEVENGHIIMYMRNNNAPYLGISHSYDYGKTWTDFKQTNIPNPNTKVTLVKSNDLILLISNFNKVVGVKNRTHLQIWVSKHGENFYNKLKIEKDNENFFYPHAFFDEKNNFYMQRMKTQNNFG